MKTVLSVMLFFLYAIVMNSQDLTKSIQENYTLSELSVRSLNASKYVRQIKMTDYSKSLGIQKFAFLDEAFSDEGAGNDLVANDGIFTSIESYDHNSNVKYQGHLNPIIVSNYLFYTEDFLHKEELKSMNGDKDGKGVSVEVEGEICFCGCERCSCLACKWWDAPGCWYFCDGIKFKIVVNW
ncbi:MAG: hypothetical protein HKO66_14700 [Saprospiraceae bacterium]|nr:hypothetical protein [Bacteroidia bacterium]NNL93488.1 hypothetical protein [Saprospiraceae bacterium]